LHMGALWKRIWSGAYNVNAPKEVREKQRERLKKEKGVGVNVDQQVEGAADVSNSMAAITG